MYTEDSKLQGTIQPGTRIIAIASQNLEPVYTTRDSEIELETGETGTVTRVNDEGEYFYIPHGDFEERLLQFDKIKKTWNNQWIDKNAIELSLPLQKDLPPGSRIWFSRNWDDVVKATRRTDRGMRAYTASVPSLSRADDHTNPCYTQAQKRKQKHQKQHNRKARRKRAAS